MNIEAEIANQKNIMAEALKHKRALSVQRKAIAAEIKGWNDSMEEASRRVELLESGDVDGFQLTLVSAVADKDHG